MGDIMIMGCVFCNRVWCRKDKYETLDVQNLDIENRTDISHGICPECFQQQKEDKVHNHQRSKGYDECFNRHEDCTNTICMFKPTCGEKALNEWRADIVVLGSC